MNPIAVVEIRSCRSTSCCRRSPAAVPWQRRTSPGSSSTTRRSSPSASLVLLTIWWHVSAKHWFTGPKHTIDEDVVEALEASRSDRTSVARQCRGPVDARPGLTGQRSGPGSLGRPSCPRPDRAVADAADLRRRRATRRQAPEGAGPRRRARRQSDDAAAVAGVARGPRRGRTNPRPARRYVRHRAEDRRATSPVWRASPNSCAAARSGRVHASSGDASCPRRAPSRVRSSSAQDAEVYEIVRVRRAREHTARARALLPAGCASSPGCSSDGSPDRCTALLRRGYDEWPQTATEFLEPFTATPRCAPAPGRGRLGAAADRAHRELGKRAARSSTRATCSAPTGSGSRCAVLPGVGQHERHTDAG